MNGPDLSSQRIVHNSLQMRLSFTCLSTINGNLLKSVQNTTQLVQLTVYNTLNMVTLLLLYTYIIQ